MRCYHSFKVISVAFTASPNRNSTIPSSEESRNSWQYITTRTLIQYFGEEWGLLGKDSKTAFCLELVFRNFHTKLKQVFPEKFSNNSNNFLLFLDFFKNIAQKGIILGGLESLGKVALLDLASLLRQSLCECIEEETAFPKPIKTELHHFVTAVIDAAFYAKMAELSDEIIPPAPLYPYFSWGSRPSLLFLALLLFALKQSLAFGFLTWIVL